MARKSADEQLDDMLDRCMTVRELVDKLQALPQDAYVGAVGHFGGFIPLDKCAVSYLPALKVYATMHTWRDSKRRDLTGKTVQIEWPDIGPDPD